MFCGRTYLSGDGEKNRLRSITLLVLSRGRTPTMCKIGAERFGLGLRIIRAGVDYYLIHQGEIQQQLGSRRQRKGETGRPLRSRRELNSGRSQEEEESCRGILDKILFFVGDLEVASTDAKRSRVL